MRLLDILFPPREDELLLREIAIDAFLGRATPRPVAATRPETIALFPYGDPVVRAAVHEAKYHGNARAFALLAGALADFLPAHMADVFDADREVALVPVPLGRARQRERGFNQAEEVARRTAKTLPSLALVPDALLRLRETATQVSLAREARADNVRGAFEAARPLDPGRAYVLLDDVVTTGATLAAAIGALAAGGARLSRIFPIALAH